MTRNLKMSGNRNKLTALAAVRAAIEEDADNLLTIMREESVRVSDLIGMCASVMEQAHGHDEAIRLLDAWALDLLIDAANDKQ
jgi:hypothetical protein